jgi:hypothetical protein
MIMTRPLRRITRQWSHMGLTLGLTFIIFPCESLSSFHLSRKGIVDVTFQHSLLVAVGDPATTQVIGAQLYNYTILRKDSNVVLSHFAGDVSEHYVAVTQLNTKHRVGQSFNYCSFDLNDTVFFGHSLFVAISGVRWSAWIVVSSFQENQGTKKSA